jgi:hypothetical protein
MLFSVFSRKQKICRCHAKPKKIFHDKKSWILDTKSNYVLIMAVAIESSNTVTAEKQTRQN